MFGAIAGFELNRQLRGHVFWVVFAISFAMVLGSVGIDQLRVGVHPGGLRNGADAIVQTHCVWSLFFMFATAAFVADAVLRDELAGFAPIFGSAPIHRFNYLGGRFAGAFAAVLLCFLSVPLGIVAGAAMPWVDPASVGPLRPAALAYAFGVVAAPNLLLSAAVGFALATASRSLGVALVGAVALLTLYGLGARAGATLPPLFEPFGFAAGAQGVAGWSAAARDVATPALSGVLLWNRVLALAIAAALLALAFVRFDGHPARRARPVRDDAPPPAATGRSAAPRFDRATPWRQVGARIRLEIEQLVRTPVFAALLLLGVANAATAFGHGPTDARVAVRALGEAFQLTPVVMTLFFSGELRWMEVERGLGPMLDAMPIARSAFLLPKFLALAAVLVGTLLTAAIAAAVVLAARGEPAATALLFSWLLGSGYDALLFAALALLLQALAPNKLAGWGFIVLYLVATLALDRLGLVDPLFRFGRYPGYPWPGSVSGAGGVAPYRLWWALVAILMLCAAVRLAGRRRGPA